MPICKFKKIKKKKILNGHLLPHFFPTGLLRLHRLGIEIAMAGMIPACFAKGDNKTAQRHLGAVLIKAPSFEQHIGGGLALPFRAAPRQGVKLAAADRIGVLPHTPAASVSSIRVSETSKNTNKATKQVFMLEFTILVTLQLVDLS